MPQSDSNAANLILLDLLEVLYSASISSDILAVSGISIREGYVFLIYLSNISERFFIR